jgi:dipeptide transport system ATP-binding protein
MEKQTLLSIENLSVTFGSGARAFRAVDGVSLKVNAGEVLAVVGESGSGKSVSMMALMGLLPDSAAISADKLVFDGQNLQTLSARDKRKIIGKDISMIFQDAMTSLNPSFTVQMQIGEVLKTHLGLRGAAVKQRILALLDLVEIPDAKNRLNVYPHQLSGGMSQRVMIAMALACEPKLLIADEPTTALDVTVQAQIMDLLHRLQREKEMAMVLITHDLGLVAENARDVAVMYAGQVYPSSSKPPRIPTPKPCCKPFPNWHSAKAACTACPAWCPANTTAPPAACSHRAAPIKKPPVMPRRRGSRAPTAMCAAFIPP